MTQQATDTHLLVGDLRSEVELHAKQICYQIGPACDLPQADADSLSNSTILPVHAADLR